MLYGGPSMQRIHTFIHILLIVFVSSSKVKMLPFRTSMHCQHVSALVLQLPLTCLAHGWKIIAKRALKGHSVCFELGYLNFMWKVSILKYRLPNVAFSYRPRCVKPTISIQFPVFKLATLCMSKPHTFHWEASTNFSWLKEPTTLLRKCTEGKWVPVSDPFQLDVQVQFKSISGDQAPFYRYVLMSI